jgi:hypothetical protein
VADDTEHPLKDIVEMYQGISDKFVALGDSRCWEYAQTLQAICAQAAHAYVELWRAHGEENIQYISFAVRNLLELMVWSQFCARSKENAARFRQDAARDMLGVGSATNLFSGWIPRDKDEAARIVNTKEGLQKLASVVGIEESDTKYLSVSRAARELSPSIQASFTSLNTVLSKFVHPTAMSVIGDFPPETVKGFNRGLLLLGTQIAVSILTTLAEVVPRVRDILN